MRFLVANRKCINQLYTKFRDNGKFEKHMQLLGTSNPTQQQRAMTLTNVRNLLIRFLNQQFDFVGEIAAKFKELIASITSNDLKCLEVVVKSWSQLLADTWDSPQDKFQQDEETLAQLTHFTFLDESKQEKDSTQYLQARLGEAKDNNEQKQMNLISQSKIDAFTDRLLMFTTGDQTSGMYRSVQAMRCR